MKKTAKKRALASRSRRLEPESLAWFREEWRSMARGFEIPEAFLTGLAQLSYENKMLRKRLSDLEAAQLSHVLEGLGVIRETEATREVMSLSEQEKGRRS